VAILDGISGKSSSYIQLGLLLSLSHKSDRPRHLTAKRGKYPIISGMSRGNVGGGQSLLVYRYGWQEEEEEEEEHRVLACLSVEGGFLSYYMYI
jgi:hypothetical protein